MVAFLSLAPLTKIISSIRDHGVLLGHEIARGPGEKLLRADVSSAKGVDSAKTVDLEKGLEKLSGGGGVALRACLEAAG